MQASYLAFLIINTYLHYIYSSLSPDFKLECNTSLLIFQMSPVMEVCP